MTTANFSRSIQYRSVGNERAVADALTVSAPYSLGAQHGDSGVDVPDTTAAATEYDITPGDIDELTYLEVKNITGQAMNVSINEKRFADVLVSGTVTISCDRIAGERLSYELGDDNGGTPTTGGYAVKRTNASTVTITAYDASGVVTADVSDITLIQSCPIRLTNGGALVVALPTAVDDPAGLAEVRVTTTDTQSGPGRVGYRMFGDPV